MRNRWTTDQIPDQRGRTALITGANSGIGFRAALELARAGARVLLGCRDLERGGEAMGQIRSETRNGEVVLIELDLADLGSIADAAEQVRSTVDSLDLLVNNAGVMATPRLKTADGFELQLGTNHLGHFALTGRLLEPLLAAEAARILTVSSTAARLGTIDFEDLHWEHRYERWRAYSRSKLANLLFTFELDRRLRRTGANALAVAVHPGYSATNLQSAGPSLPGSSIPGLGHLYSAVMAATNRILAQSEEMGTLPTLYAATAPGVSGSDYYGPDGIGEMRGHPGRASVPPQATNLDHQRRLWEVSVEATGVDYAALEPTAA